ncbi:MAG: hypothetical protein RQ885_09490 [Desulfurococcales archaeon]|jgi:ribosomal protein L44E|nr:hypothetical protein [Desulfurococcales archaeon]
MGCSSSSPLRPPVGSIGARDISPRGIKNTGIHLPGWRLRCRSCGKTWIFEASYRVSELETLYHYCRNCRKNTFHEIIEKIE